MTTLYCDAEFNGFNGELMSVALVPADSGLPSFYAVVEYDAPVEPWNAINVVPHLHQAAESRESAARRCAAYLRTHPTRPVIVADWPKDLSEFANLFLLQDRPGRMVNVVEFDLQYRRFPDFNSSRDSSEPHNALADATALRDHVEKK